MPTISIEVPHRQLARVDRAAKVQGASRNQLMVACASAEAERVLALREMCARTTRRWRMRSRSCAENCPATCPATPTGPMEPPTHASSAAASSGPTRSYPQNGMAP